MKTKKHLQISAALVVLGAAVTHNTVADKHAYAPVNKGEDFTKVSTDIHGEGCHCMGCCGIQKRFAPRQ